MIEMWLFPAQLNTKISRLSAGQVCGWIAPKLAYKPPRVYVPPLKVSVCVHMYKRCQMVAEPLKAVYTGHEGGLSPA